jgi:hypothetical protein
MPFIKRAASAAFLSLVAACASTSSKPPPDISEPLIPRERQAQLYIELLPRLEKAGLTVHAVNEKGSIVLLPAGMCIPPVNPDNVRREALKAIEVRFSEKSPRGGTPMFVVPEVCQPMPPGR